MNDIGTQLRDPINSGLARWRMAVLNKEMDAAAELGRNPVSKHQIQPEYGDEQADAGRDCRTCLARLDSQARMMTGNMSRMGYLTRLIHTLAICVTLNNADSRPRIDHIRGLLYKAGQAWGIGVARCRDSTFT